MQRLKEYEADKAAMRDEDKAEHECYCCQAHAAPAVRIYVKDPGVETALETEETTAEPVEAAERLGPDSRLYEGVQVEDGTVRIASMEAWRQCQSTDEEYKDLIQYFLAEDELLLTDRIRTQLKTLAWRDGLLCSWYDYAEGRAQISWNGGQTARIPQYMQALSVSAGVVSDKSPVVAIATEAEAPAGQSVRRMRVYRHMHFDTQLNQDYIVKMSSRPNLVSHIDKPATCPVVASFTKDSKLFRQAFRKIRLKFGQGVRWMQWNFRKGIQ
eukprot:g33369.t1